ncbi:hypothetical protein CDEF62S_02384 [Castellaniella defragrans]
MKKWELNKREMKLKMISLDIVILYKQISRLLISIHKEKSESKRKLQAYSLRCFYSDLEEFNKKNKIHAFRMYFKHQIGKEKYKEYILKIRNQQLKNRRKWMEAEYQNQMKQKIEDDEQANYVMFIFIMAMVFNDQRYKLLFQIEQFKAFFGK